MSRIMITGGAGFIGSNLARALIERGDEVIIFDDFSSGRRSNFADIADKLEVVEGDLRDLDQLQAVSKGLDYILHQGAVPSVPRSMDDPITSHDVNSRGTMNVLLAARDNKVKRVVMAASSSAYGDSETLPKIESMPTVPKSPYAADKVYGEHIAKIFYDGYGLETVALRYFNVFGPYQSPESDYAAAIPRFVTKLLAGEQPMVYGDGEQSRDFTYIDNVIQANLLAMTAEKAPGHFMNVGIGERITINDVIHTIAKVIGVEANISYLPDRVGDVKHSLASIDRARDLLGYEPKVGLAEGLERTINWYREEAKAAEKQS